MSIDDGTLSSCSTGWIYLMILGCDEEDTMVTILPSPSLPSGHSNELNILLVMIYLQFSVCLYSWGWRLSFRYDDRGEKMDHQKMSIIVIFTHSLLSLSLLSVVSLLSISTEKRTCKYAFHIIFSTPQLGWNQNQKFNLRKFCIHNKITEYQSWRDIWAEF